MAQEPNIPPHIMAQLQFPRDWQADLKLLTSVLTAKERPPFLRQIPEGFQQPGDAIMLVWPNSAQERNWLDEFGITAFAQVVLGNTWGSAQNPAPRHGEALPGLLALLRLRNFVHSASIVGAGGLAATLARSTEASGLGAHVNVQPSEAASAFDAYFGEPPSRLLLTCKWRAHLALVGVVERHTHFNAACIGRVKESGLHLLWDGRPLNTRAPE